MGVLATGSLSEHFRRLIVANISPCTIAPILEVLYEWGILDTDSLIALFHNGDKSPREVASALLAETKVFTLMGNTERYKDTLTNTCEALVTLRNLSRANIGSRAIENPPTGPPSTPTHL